MESKESYPHPVDKVEHIQTHISHVFIAGPFVYKLKKHVDFGFLDYSTLNKRKKYCHREVELNRRLSDDIYIGVVGICRKEGHFNFEESNNCSDPIIEYVVKMRKLNEAYFLNRIVEDGELSNVHLDRVADTLTPFYLKQKQGRKLSKWGEVQTIKVNTDENFRQTEQFIGHTIQRNAYEAVRYFTNHYFQKNQQLFQRRIEDGRIVDGHGDLHLEHIHITPEKVQIYDCIEFNERFRYGDLAADLAFLSMDFDFNRCRKEERYFIEKMSNNLKDDDLIQIIDFYKCYRAYVKGKVKSFQSVEEEVPKKERKRSSKRAIRYFKLSHRYALMGSEPMVIIFMGRVATGKSTLAGVVADHLDIKHHSSDIIRKTLAGVSQTERTPETKRSALYSPGMFEKTYDTLISRALHSIKSRETVILDATYSKSAQRRNLINSLKHKSTPYLFIELKSRDETITERLKSRDEKSGVISDARLEDFETLTAGFQPPKEIDERHLIKIDTEQSPNDSVEQLYKEMIDIHLRS
ncbi:MAG: AAA family ATPase [Balneolaceae bacterium]|nr:AAA family ATPase [Balneolaceae bacterium]